MSDEKNTPDKPGQGAAQDRDAMDKLSLSIIPLSSAPLKAARLVKNSQLETMVELHSDKASGSLQVRPEDIAASFPSASPEDIAIIGKLSALHSYDVYSLRSSLAKLGIEVDKSQLELSDATKERLERSAMEFIRPLVVHLFGGDGSVTADTPLSQLLRDPDVAKVQLRLRKLSERTGIPLSGIPDFLAGYRDIFLSTVYYRDSFDSIAPDMNRFWLWLGELKNHRETSASPAALVACNNVATHLRNLFTSTRERLNKFKAAFEFFWNDMNPASFQRLHAQIGENHDAMGAVLCGLGVKMRSWSAAFPDNNAGGPAARLAYVASELEPGLDQLMAIENDARAKLGMPRLRAR